MLLEGGTAAKRIPDTLQAIIAARIDRLPRAEKSALQRASVVGRIFWEGALERLAPDLELEGTLDDLLGRDFLTRESRSSISGERAYRFKHVLIRDVAYAGLTKGARADLHQVVAAWLGERAPDELVEIRAYHLEQAATLLEELDGVVPQGLVTEAAAMLEAAGRRALVREANRSARRLLLRAVELEPTLDRRFQAARAAWRLDDLPAVAIEMEAVHRLARETGDETILGRSLTALAHVTLLRDADLPRARAFAEQALATLEESDSLGRFDALALLSQIAWWRGDLDEDERHTRTSIELARQLEREDLEADAVQRLASAYIQRGELEEAEQLIDRAWELAQGSGSIVARAQALGSRGNLAAQRGQIEAAGAAFEEAAALYEEAGAAWPRARVLSNLAKIAHERGDLTAAERLFRDAIRILTSLEDRGTLCESQRGLAQVLLVQGRVDEAEQQALEARRTVGPHDQSSRATTRMALGLVRAAQSHVEEAELLLREAVDIIKETDFLVHHREILEALVGFLRDQGRESEVAAYEDELATLVRSAAPIA